MTETSKRIRIASYLMMISVALSGVLGFLRDRVMSQLEGANSQSDVYFQSFLIPDIINHLMASGALSVSFVPLLATYLANNDQAGANDLFRGVATLMGSTLLVLIGIGEIFASSLALWIAPGFSHEQLELLTELLRVILPAQFFFYVGGLAISIQYAHKKFFLPALAPLVYNLGIILCGVLLHPYIGVKGFSIGVLVGCAISHGVLQFVGIYRLGYRILPRFRYDAQFKSAFTKYLLLTLPVMVGFSLVVSDEWLTKYFGSLMEEGAVSWLNYARRLMRLPVNVIAQAAGLASFPFLASLWAERKFEQYGHVLLNEVQKLWAATTLATIFMVFQAEPIVYILFSGGKFNVADVAETAEALRIFSLGIFFWSSQTILARGFYATQNTWLPSLVGTIVAICFIPVYRSLGTQRGFVGLAWAGSLGVSAYTFCLAGLLFYKIRKHASNLSFRDFALFCGQWILIVSAGIGIAAGIRHLGFYEQTRTSALVEVLLSLLLLIGLGLLSVRTYFKRFTGGEPLF